MLHTAHCTQTKAVICYPTAWHRNNIVSTEIALKWCMIWRWTVTAFRVHCTTHTYTHTLTWYNTHSVTNKVKQQIIEHGQWSVFEISVKWMIFLLQIYFVCTLCYSSMDKIIKSIEYYFIYRLPYIRRIRLGSRLWT